MNYYEETLLKIDQLLKENKELEVKEIIDNELKVPYLPKDFETKIRNIYSKLDFSNITNNQLTFDQIKEYLFSTPEKQLISVDALCNLNLRDYIELINSYLQSDGYLNAKVILIDSLIKQEISDEILFNNNDIEYRFIPRFIEPIETSEGYLEAIKYINDIYAKDPSKAMLAKELIYKEAMLSLPVNFEANEGIILAKKAIEYIEKAFK